MCIRDRSYISRQPRRNLEIVTRYAGDRRYMGMNNLADRHNRSYFGLEFVYDTIPNELVPFDYQTFAAYPGPVSYTHLRETWSRWTGQCFPSWAMS